MTQNDHYDENSPSNRRYQSIFLPSLFIGLGVVVALGLFIYREFIRRKYKTPHRPIEQINEVYLYDVVNK